MNRTKPLSQDEANEDYFRLRRADLGLVDKKVLDAQRKRPPRRAQDNSESVVIGLSDDELALRFSALHENALRYVAAWDRWLIWDGCRWAVDERKRVFDMARALCRDVLTEHLAEAFYTEIQRKTLRGRLGSAATIYAVVKLASTDPRHSVTVQQLDSYPWKLNTPGGTLDLTTGVMQPHDPAELHTKITAATPGGECPLFLGTIERALPGAEIRDYLQRLVGYGLTGSSREHVLPIGIGTGRNMKGTIMHAVRRALGDYGLEIGPELLMESHNERHPTETAVLRGARFVVVSEIDTGRKWNESKLKRLTGGDPISARYIGKDLFEFEPTHTLMVIANTKPGLRNVDEAMRSRLHLIEFGVTLPESERDASMPEKLQAEYGGILAWALAGCLSWQRMGLAPPDSVRIATTAYLDGEDSIATWVAECCERHGQIKLSAAHQSYRDWCEHNGAIVLGRNNFSDALAAHGYKRGKDSRAGTPVFAGLSLPISADSRYSE